MGSLVSGQDGLTETGFIFSPARTKKKSKLYESKVFKNTGHQPTESTDPWQTRNKWSQQSKCPNSLLWENFQVMAQRAEMRQGWWTDCKLRRPRIQVTQCSQERRVNCTKKQSRKSSEGLPQVFISVLISNLIICLCVYSFIHISIISSLIPTWGSLFWLDIYFENFLE